MKRLFLLAIVCAAIISLQAQVITWAVKPGVYSKIEPCWGDMYFVYNGNNIGVINGDGSEVVTPNASRVTGFYGGHALVLKSDGGKERVMGILSTDGTYLKIDGTYYTIPYQEFFSEGLLTITDSRGQAGYMNENGVVVKSFKVSFISPFSEGYAVVGENEEYTLVDRRFNTLSIQLGSVSQVYGGSNVYNGVAIIWDGNGKFYNYDVNRGICKRISEPKSLEYDYMYCFSIITKRSESVPYEQPIRSSKALTVIEKGNKFGYANEGKNILPCQFEQAESFYGNYAIVRLDGKCGIISLHKSEECFNAVATNSQIKYKKNENKDISHNFRIAVPSKWNTDKINVIIKDDNGIHKDVVKKNGNFEFLGNGAIGNKKFSVEVESEGLILWTGELTYNYEQKKDDPILPPPPVDGAKRVRDFAVTLKLNNDQADKNNHCNVTATIYNPNSEDISALVTFTGSNLLESISKRITVPAKGTKNVGTYFTVKQRSAKGQNVTVTTSAGGTATLSGLQLIPF